LGCRHSPCESLNIPRCRHGRNSYGWGETVNGNVASPQNVQRSPDRSIKIESCPTGRSGWTCLIESGSTRILEGDSGGPVLVSAAGAWQLAAVVDQNDPVNGVVHPDAFAWPVSTAQPAARSWIQHLIGVPQLASGSIIRDQGSGHSWLVEADAYRHSIPTGGDYLCFETQTPNAPYNYPLLQVETIPDDVGSTAKCTPNGGGGTGGGGGQSISIAWSTSHPTWIAMTLNGFAPGRYTYTCDFASGGDSSYNLTETAEPQTFDNGATCFDGISGDQVWVNIGSVVSNTLVVGGSTSPPPPPATFSEQEGHHGVNTFTNYHNASGLGPFIAAAQWVQVSCKVYDPTIASVNPDGYWYRIASSPWNNAYYSPANTFMNGDPWNGPYTHNTDFAVPNC
jgi:hypothetical protein